MQLKPYIAVDNTIKDTFEFISKLKEINIEPSDHMASLNVVSLFTRIPVSETIAYIKTLIPAYTFPISLNTIGELLELSCKNILFSFNEKLFTQKDGMCIGSNLGPTMAAFAMHMVEKKLSKMPKFYKRYVDDIFFITNNKAEADNPVSYTHLTLPTIYSV